MVPTLGDAALEDVALVAQALFGAPERAVEFRKVSAADVAQLATLQVVPNPFDRGEIGRVSRQLLQVDALGRATGQEVLDGVAAVNRSPIGR
jgi:hypothetical protein